MTSGVTSGASAAFEIEGQVVNVASADEAIGAIIARLARPGSFMLCTLNLDHLVKLRSDAAFARAYRKAEFVTADGFPIVTLARMSGRAIGLTTGSDLVMPLCQAAAEAGLPIFLFGTSEEALAIAGARLMQAAPGLDIRGRLSPSRDFSVDSEEAREAIQAIERSGARICFVALGAPRQEIFAAAAIEQTSDIAFLSIGGSLDFIAGLQTRSPPFLRRLKLEWAWRLASDPRRLGGRYARSAILFIELLMRRLLAR